jgi:hypothetical protein
MVPQAAASNLPVSSTWHAMAVLQPRFDHCRLQLTPRVRGLGRPS